MGGRIGRAKHLVASLLNVNPLISMENGIIVPVGTSHSRKRVCQMMVDRVESAIGYQRKINIAYVHAAALGEAQKIKDLIEARFTVVESIITELTPALRVHSGPGTAGLCHYPVNW